MLINDDIYLFFLLLPPLCSHLCLIQTLGICLYGNSDQPVSHSDACDPFLRCEVRETLNTRP